MEQFAQSYSSLPENPGIYIFLDNKGHVLYVGKAKNLKKRISTYFTNRDIQGTKTKAMVSRIKAIKFILVESEIESLLLEARYVKKYNPKYNIRLTDGKAYPLIRITVRDDYPAVLVARRPEDKKSIYFGPFPSSKAMKMVLKTVRRVFPYQSVLNHLKKVCLYNHLGLCPCPPVFDSPEFKKTYKKTIAHLVAFLDGNIKKVIRDLEKEREGYSRKEDFEKAMQIQQKIDAIYYITTPFHAPLDYETNPNLRWDLRQKELTSLSEKLGEFDVSVGSLQRIECFDISNFAGTNSVGSMVVFIEGEKNTDLYRRFKISENIVGPNDFASMEEVLKRRLKHTEWEYPDLIIVDGGKGQITSALKALRAHNVSIPLIGLAKREEILITPAFEEIVLPKDSKALHLVMRIRDEAHRFAVQYHRKLRSRFLTS